jgi:hypothetical protein
MALTSPARAPLHIQAIRITIMHIPSYGSAEDIGAIKCWSEACISNPNTMEGEMITVELTATLYVPGEHTHEEAEEEAMQWAGETDWVALTASDHPVASAGRTVQFDGVFELKHTEV